MKNKITLKILSLILIIALTVPALVSCGSIPEEKTVVGTVNGENVYYDELYFLVSNYISSVKETYGDDEAKVREELDKLVKENITVNFAIIALCEKEGFKYEDIEDKIDDEIDVMITQDFADDKDAFKTSLDTYGMTERYLRYTTGVDLLAAKLPEVYMSRYITGTESAVISTIKENFIRTNHLVLFNDNGDDKTVNYTKLEEAVALMSSGEKTMGQLITKGYSEDFSDVDGSGYYIVRGLMIEEYENAAFELEIGETSGIIEAKSENNQGEYVSCYYVIQRLALDDDYIDDHYSELKNDYVNVFINNDLQTIRTGMVFTPNEVYGELDLLNLEKPTQFSVTLVIIIAVSCVVAVAGVIITILIVKNIHKKKNVSSVKKAKKSGRK